MSRRKRSQEARELIPFLANVLNGQGGAARTVIRTTESGGSGVSDHGALTGLGDDDHSQYLRVDGVRAMSGNLNLADNDITNVRFINGLLLDDFVDDVQELQADVLALEGRTVLGGDGILSDEVTLGVGSPTVEVDEAFAFAWTGNHTHTGVSAYASFDAGDPIVGAKIDWANGLGWFAGLEATSLTVKTFISDVTLALQGSQYITKSKAELSRNFSSPSTTGTLYVMDLPGQPDTAVFETGDYVRLRYVNRATGLNVGDVWGTVSAYTDLDDGEQSWTFTRTAGDVGQTIYAGMVALDYGKSGDGYIELSSLGDDTPVVRLRTWVTNPAVAGNHTTRAILGNLSGHTDADYGSLSAYGYGLFSDTMIAKGQLMVGGGDVVAGDDGLNIQAGTAAAGVFSELSDKLTFTTDPMSSDETDVVAQMWGTRYTASGSVVNQLVLESRGGADYLVDRSGYRLEASERASSSEIASAFVNAFTEGGIGTLQLGVTNSSAQFSGIDLSGNAVTITTQQILPGVGSATTLGSPTKKLAAIYVDVIYAGTTSSTDTGHNHNDLYPTRAEVAGWLAAKADAVHYHGSYITSAALTAALADYIDEDALAVALSAYDTTAELDAKLLLKSGVGHSHNLADLDERNYGSLQSRGHVLASTAGLGSDHTVSGLTAGMVLRATGGTTARFMTLNYADLANRTHDIASEHSGSLPWDRVAKTGSNLAQLATRQYSALTDRTHLITGGDHSITGARYSVVGTPAADDTLGVWATDSDGTAGNVLLRSDDNGGLSLQDLDLAGDATVVGTVAAAILAATTQVNATKLYAVDAVNFADATGIYGKVTRTGIESVDPAFASGVNRSGLRVTWTGDANFRDVEAVNLSTFVFEKRRVAAVGGTLAINEAGKLYADLALTTIGATVTVDVADADAEGVTFDTGDILRISGLAYAQPPASSSSTSFAGLLPSPFLPAFAVDGAPRPATAYLRVTGATANSGYVRYTAVYEDGPVHVKFLKGTGLVRWSGGMITLTSTGDPFGPYIDIFNAGSTPWVAGSSTHYARIGRIDGLGVVSGGEQYGFVFSADADDATAARIAGSSLGTFQLFKTGIIGNDGAYNTFQLDPDGTFKLGTNVDAEATTFVEFDPSVDEGAYASVIIRARLQSSVIELPQGEIAVYVEEDLFDEGYSDYWTAKVNRYGFQVTGGLPDAYTTDSAGIHRFTDQGYEIRHNAEADIGTPSVYPIFRLTGTGAGNMSSYVADTDQETGETTDFGSYDWTEWSFNDPIIKLLAMFAPDATASGQLYSSQAQMEFGALNLETGEELRAFTVYGDDQGLSRMQVVADELYIDSETVVDGNVTFSGDFILNLRDAETGEVRKVIWRSPPTSSTDAAAGELWVDPAASYAVKWNPA